MEERKHSEDGSGIRHRGCTRDCTLFAVDGGGSCLRPAAATVNSSDAEKSLELDIKQIEGGHVGLGSLIALIFFQTAGGPYGIEETVATGGPLAALISTLLMPIVFNLPIALISTELSCAIPHDGGLVLWSDRSFGSFWAFQVSWWNLTSGFIGMSTLPNQFTDYIFSGTGMVGVFLLKVSLHFIMILAAFLVNLKGTGTVGDMSIGLGLFLMSPFLVMVILGLPHIDMNVFYHSAAPTKWAKFLAITMWSQSGWDGASLLAGEIKDIGKTFLPAMKISLVLVGLTYSLPIFVGVGVVHDDLSKWKDGYFVDVADRIGVVSVGSGHWLKLWVTIAGMMSAFGLLAGSLCSNSRSLFACSHLGLLPKMFTKVHPTWKTPWSALLFLSFGTALLSPFFTFSSLVRLNMAFYCISMLLTVAVFMFLRRFDPHLHRPYKIPGGAVGAAIVIVPLVAVCVTFLAILDVRGLVIVVVILLLGPIMYMLCLFLQRNTSWFLPIATTQIGVAVFVDQSGTVPHDDVESEEAHNANNRPHDTTETQSLLSNPHHSDKQL